MKTKQHMKSYERSYETREGQSSLTKMDEAVKQKRPRSEAFSETTEEKQGGLILRPKSKQISERKSKYIANLQRATKRREIEKEIIEEKLLKKDMKDNADKYEKTEVFVTSSYKKVLNERRQLERDMLEKDKHDLQNDVMKKKHMNDFHRYLLEKRSSEMGPTAPSSKSNTNTPRPS